MGVSNCKLMADPTRDNANTKAKAVFRSLGKNHLVMIALCATVNVSAPNPYTNRPTMAIKKGYKLCSVSAVDHVAANATIKLPAKTNMTHMDIPNR